MRREEERRFHSDRRARVEGGKKRAGLGVVGEKKGDEGGQCGLEGGRREVTIMIWREYELRSD